MLRNKQFSSENIVALCVISGGNSEGLFGFRLRKRIIDRLYSLQTLDSGYRQQRQELYDIGSGSREELLNKTQSEMKSQLCEGPCLPYWVSPKQQRCPRSSPDTKKELLYHPGLTSNVGSSEAE